ncbi:MAG TPA: PH domain-containing protein [Candidatus Paceibacterota bacterium]|nr:PH domain-containing protein [Candidatus Paceibacterota bacterium]
MKTIMAPEKDNIIYEQKLHYGIFVLPFLALVISVFPLGFLYLSFNIIMMPIRQMQPNSAPHLTWLITLPIMLFLIANAGFFIVIWLAHRNNVVRLTTNTLAIRSGFISRNVAILNVGDIESVFLRQPLLGRLLGYGTVVAVGTGGTPFHMQFMPEPTALYEMILDAKSRGKLPKKETRRNDLPPQDDSRYMPKG